MKYTHEQQTNAIDRAAHKLKLDAHITTPEYKKDLCTHADKIIGWWFRKYMPIKKSFMMCETLDMDFFFTQDGTAVYTYAGYADARDGNEKIIKAFRTANLMRETMQKEIESEV